MSFYYKAGLRHLSAPLIVMGRDGVQIHTGISAFQQVGGYIRDTGGNSGVN